MAITNVFFWAARRLSSGGTAAAAAFFFLGVSTVVDPFVLSRSKDATRCRSRTCSDVISLRERQLGTVSTDEPFRRPTETVTKKSGERERRTRQTPADIYYARHGKIPLPSVVHATLPPPFVSTDDYDDQRHRKGMLIIGDVHGCLSELKSLHIRAVEANGGAPFQHVILVGDLVNKGPNSAGVVRYVRENGWLAVRGNHDDSALAAALGDVGRRGRATYRWVLEGEDTFEEPERVNGTPIDPTADEERVTLSDDDVTWLSELPYTITIPRNCLVLGDGEKDEEETVIVHAGLVPGVDISSQLIEAMVTVREVQQLLRVRDEAEYQYVPKRPKPKSGTGKITATQEKQQSGTRTAAEFGVSVPWALHWMGPPLVVFGHDARRGLQLYDWAIGLDTGVCYGKELTGLILPGRKLVSVKAEMEHCPIGG